MDPTENTQSPHPPVDCPLTWPQQRRNLLLYAVCKSCTYLAAPVMYVGISQASLCDRLGADTRTANLPGSLFFAMCTAPALIAWLSPRASVVQRNLSWCFGASALIVGITAALLALRVSPGIILAMVIAQGGVLGVSSATAECLLWEVIGRGSSTSVRGTALGLAFGFGPMLAVVGSLCQAAIFGGDFFGHSFVGLSYPLNFVLLFGCCTPIMLVPAILARFFIVPPVEQEAKREPVRDVFPMLIGFAGMLLAVGSMQVATWWQMEAIRGISYVSAIIAAAAFLYHFRAILGQRILLLATLVTLLVYAGETIPINMNLYSKLALGDAPEKFAGVQNALRFGFKIGAGFFLGWLLTRTNPRMGILVTAGFFLASQAWALLVTGPWYLIAFGIYGAGELIGIYAPNYIVSASRPGDLRRNTSFLAMLSTPSAVTGFVYGSLVDLSELGQWQFRGFEGSELGFRLSFVLCGTLISLGILGALLLLPKHPKP